MRGADSDEHARLPYFEPPKPVNDSYPVDSETIVNMFRDFLHLGERHGFVRFVLQIKRGSPVRMVAHAAIERSDGAVLIGANFAGDSGIGNDFACEFDAILR